MPLSKTPADDHYIRYDESIETIQPDEAKLIDKVVASMSRVGQSVCDKHRHASRNACKEPRFLDRGADRLR